MIALDDMLDAPACAAWLKMTERQLGKKSRTGEIPCFRIGPQTLRYHPRTIIAKLATDAGVRVQVIMAALNHKSYTDEKTTFHLRD